MIDIEITGENLWGRRELRYFADRLDPTAARGMSSVDVDGDRG